MSSPNSHAFKHYRRLPEYSGGTCLYLQVSSLPPFTSYVHANYPIWLHNHQVILDDRPPTDIGSLTWAAHGCDDMYAPH